MNKPALYWPLKTPCIITQKFGVNGAWYKAHGINIEGHSGLDLLAAHGEVIRAAHDGWAWYEVDKNGGHQIFIRSAEEALMFGSPCYFKTGYCHMVDPAKEPNLRSPIPNDGREHWVRTGDVIGYADNTGFSTGNHLHFLIKALAKDSKGRWFNLRNSNGYAGASDPTFYMQDMSAESYAIVRDTLKDAEELVMTMPLVTVQERQKRAYTLTQILTHMLRWIESLRS